jgi:hypothetical protein
MDSAGNVTYARNPDEDHGAHNFADYEERHTSRIQFSPVHTGDQPYPHVDANKRVDGKKVRDKDMHHQEQSPGYGPDAVDVPIRHPEDD